jgi:hypothetical protein
MPVMPIIADRTGGAGSGLAAVTVRGRKKGIGVAQSIQMPKKAVT